MKKIFALAALAALTMACQSETADDGQDESGGNAVVVAPETNGVEPQATRLQRCLERADRGLIACGTLSDSCWNTYGTLVQDCIDFYGGN